MLNGKTNITFDGVLSSSTSNTIGTSDIRSTTFSISEREETYCDTNIENTSTINTTIYRYNFNSEFNTELFKFANILNSSIFF